MRYCARRVLFWLFCALVWSAAVPSPGALTSQPVALAAGTEPNVATMEPAPNLQAANAAQAVTEADTGSTSIFGRALQGGFIVFFCLLILLSMSVVTWAVIVAKYVYLQRLAKSGESFTKSFWDSRSLNDLSILIVQCGKYLEAATLNWCEAVNSSDRSRRKRSPSTLHLITLIVLSPSPRCLSGAG